MVWLWAVDEEAVAAAAGDSPARAGREPVLLDRQAAATSIWSTYDNFTG